jgi:adenine-specific DNA methylase
MLGKSEKEEASLHSEHNAELFAGITIVARYMKLHPQYTISNLLDNENSMDIFNGAGYTMK